MDKNGSIPQPLLPGGQALVNPHLMDGHNFYVLPEQGKVLVMMDKLGNENYQPMLIPVEGGIPEKGLGDRYKTRSWLALSAILTRALHISREMTGKILRQNACALI